MRLGWLVAPDRLLSALAHGKRVADRGCPTLDQLALALLMESGRYDRHLRRARAEYAPGLRLTGLAAGFHAVLHLPAGTDEEQLIEQARQRGVGLHGLARMCRTTPTEPRLVLGFGDTSQRSIEAGIAAIADLHHGQSQDKHD